MPGSTPPARNQATRWTSVAVLPVPAPATISSGPSPWVATLAVLRIQPAQIVRSIQKTPCFAPSSPLSPSCRGLARTNGGGYRQSSRRRVNWAFWPPDFGDRHGTNARPAEARLRAAAADGPSPHADRGQGLQHHRNEADPHRAGVGPAALRRARAEIVVCKPRAVHHRRAGRGGGGRGARGDSRRSREWSARRTG